MRLSLGEINRFYWSIKIEQIIRNSFESI